MEKQINFELQLKKFFLLAVLYAQYFLSLEMNYEWRKNNQKIDCKVKRKCPIRWKNAIEIDIFMVENNL